ncbi:MAG: metalloregulator ArsR/SmtB family transcription factor [Saccharofermentans sp.]|nr:metalloregulator ArsR/SmtB family transcription factor [Saccharofermentans sp.]
MQKGIAKYSSALTVMAEPMRQNILSMVGSAGRLRGKDILDQLDLTQPTLSHHMNVLLGANLITARKEGRCVWYSVNKTTVKAISDAILSLSQEQVGIAPAIKKVVPIEKPAKKIAEVIETPDVLVKVKKDKVKDKDKDKKKKKKSKDKEKDKAKKKKK